MKLNEKHIWLEKFERILTEIYIKWSGVIIIAGDLNTDILNGNNSHNVVKKPFYIQSHYVNIKQKQQESQKH